MTAMTTYSVALSANTTAYGKRSTRRRRTFVSDGTAASGVLTVGFSRSAAREFSVSLTGTIDFASSLDSYVSGRGTPRLAITGFPITIDATAVAATTFNVDFGAVGSGANVPTTYSLVPGIYVMCVPASNDCFDFSVTPTGTLAFDSSLDARVSGRGTTTLLVGQRPVPPPTVSCVGASAQPVVIATPSDSCGVAIGAGAAAAGACASGNGGPVTCTFDGQATETLGPGVHAVLVVAAGSDGQRVSCTSYVRIVDATPPSLAEAPSPSTLWPPNHKLVLIDLHLQASDNCALAAGPTCAVTSSESPSAPGSGNTNPDIVWNDGALYLRAERSGQGSGRTYTITCTATDTSGNFARKTATVSVPH